MNEGLGNIKTKVVNTFNVVGSNWSVRRVVNLNATILYDIISFTSLARLVKGKLECQNVATTTTTTTTTTAEGELNIDAKKLQIIFELMYDGFLGNRLSQERLHRLMKCQAASLTHTSSIRNTELTNEDREFFKSFSRKTIKTLKKSFASSSVGKKPKQKPKKQPSIKPPPPAPTYTHEQSTSSSSSSKEETIEQPPPPPKKFAQKTSVIVPNNSKAKRKLVMKEPENNKKTKMSNETTLVRTVPRGKKMFTPIPKAPLPPIVFSGKNINGNFFDINKGNKRRESTKIEEINLVDDDDDDDESEDDKLEKLEQEMVSIITNKIRKK